MPAKIFIFVFICLDLFGVQDLQNTYYVTQREVNASVITQNPKDSFPILKIASNNYKEKIKSKRLIRLLKDHGISKYSYKSSYVYFVLQSPIDTSIIKKKIQEEYEKKYLLIDIEDIFVEPRTYMETLPREYTVHMRNRDYLSKEGTVSIKSLDNKRYFFDYVLKAFVWVYKSKKQIKRETPLSLVDFEKKRVLLERFRDKPAQKIEKRKLQARRHISRHKILTQRDIESIDVVQRNSMINVMMSQGGMSIVFSAKALQDAKVNDIISVQNSNGKILKVKVLGSNRAELK